MWQRLMLLVGAMALVNCADPAEQDLRSCERYAAEGNLIGARDACTLASMRAQSDKVRTAIAAKRKELEPALQKWEQEQAAAQVRADEERSKRWQAEAEARAAAVTALRKKVSKRYWGKEPDGSCTGHGLPPYKWEYEGGTYDEDQQVAMADGCKKLFQAVELQSYCCSQRPVSISF